MINKKELIIIAEVKTNSPFGYISKKNWDELFELANSIGDIISIHTDSRWEGSFELIKKARTFTTKPILAKGIHATDTDIQKALEAGADYVLVVGRIPKIHLDKCFIEPNSLEELKGISENCKVVWNSRDLSTGLLKVETFKQARELHSGWLCQASNIQTITDIEISASAILVGTYLKEFAESIQ